MGVSWHVLSDPETKAKISQYRKIFLIKTLSDHPQFRLSQSLKSSLPGKVKLSLHLQSRVL
jgi:hypothetical protein